MENSVSWIQRAPTAEDSSSERYKRKPAPRVPRTSQGSPEVSPLPWSSSQASRFPAFEVCFLLK